MASTANRKTGQKVKRGRENRRRERDRKIFGMLRLLVGEAERRHAQFDEPVEPLSVFMGKEGRPPSWELSPFPMEKQDNGKPMPKWEDLSQWMKVMMATMAGHQWNLLTFNINLHPELEANLVNDGQVVRTVMAERVRKHLSRSIGNGREYFFVIEGHEKRSGGETGLHLHGAIAIYAPHERKVVEDAIAKAAGQDVHGRGRVKRSVHSKPFSMIRVAYGNYLFKFARKFDPRLDDRRLVMSQAMTGAARMLWSVITRPEPG